VSRILVSCPATTIGIIIINNLKLKFTNIAITRGVFVGYYFHKDHLGKKNFIKFSSTIFSFIINLFVGMANAISSAGINLGAALNLLITPFISDAYGVIWVDLLGVLIAITTFAVTLWCNHMDLKVET
jgi:hypothetical protein